MPASHPLRSGGEVRAPLHLPEAATTLVPQDGRLDRAAGEVGGLGRWFLEGQCVAGGVEEQDIGIGV